MTYKSLTIPAILLLTGAFVAGACTIGTIDDEDLGGLGGEGGAGSGSGGASTGGSAATGGDGGAGGAPVTFDCQEDSTAVGTLASTEPDAGDDACTACQKSVCGESYAVCNASDPETGCRYGSTSYDGMAIDGEWDCIDSCMVATGAAFDEGEVEDCAALCGSAQCDSTSAGPVATELMKCMILGNGGDDCYDECY